jgi:hypothetical protein
MWHAWKSKERHTGFWWGILQERDCLADIGIIGRVILK